MYSYLFPMENTLAKSATIKFATAKECSFTKMAISTLVDGNKISFMVKESIFLLAVKFMTGIS